MHAIYFVAFIRVELSHVVAMADGGESNGDCLLVGRLVCLIDSLDDLIALFPCLEAHERVAVADYLRAVLAEFCIIVTIACVLVHD